MILFDIAQTLQQLSAAMPFDSNAQHLKELLQSADELFSRKRLCSRWDCSNSSLKRYEGRGLKVTRIGPRMVRYRLADVEAFERVR